MRLVDANDFFERLCDRDCDIVPQYSEDGYSIERIEETLNATPTVDAVPARHGYWVIADADKGEYICSVCGETDTDCSDRYSNHNVFSQEYCPNCGAKMDGDEA